MANLPTVDLIILSELKDIMEESFSEIMIEFRDEIPSYKNSMTDFLTDAEKLSILTHTIKSSSANLGFVRLSENCRKIEEGLRIDATMKVDSLVDECKNELDMVYLEIEKILAS